MKNLKDLLKILVEKEGSDLHISVNVQPVIRINGELNVLNDKNKITKDEVKNYAMQLLGDDYDKYLKAGEFDASYTLNGVGMFRVNVYKERGNDAIAVRNIPSKILSPKELGFPDVFNDLINAKMGLVLVTGPTGSGKSTTVASIINEFNLNTKRHIITLEDPIEYVHKSNKSLINQREIGKDSGSYVAALKAALREDPDVIFVGEMRDMETITAAITAAETGHLVLSTLHTIGADKTIDRIIDVFPEHNQTQVRIQLASVLKGVVSQQLLKKKDESGRIPAFEIMTFTPAVQNLIREGKTHQIQSLIQTGSKYGMITMDKCIIDLYKKGIISYETAVQSSVDKEFVTKMLIL
ncbi:twitching motility protein PilT [Clostridium acetobutylicum]|uniref:PilT ATPase involved in pili biogenesis n=1 Tax=Clostridium acetobutylicum (strain ATCC 824 / DSM 792 / JCM 1419 / IAM 19013 / LMG 5710 / NBRC 13948 / NRRL B-527 / VKM B-1787 / 2291 / W) TaxID=272562 RepID=Q97IF2_CLOAB|nr:MULTISPECIES: type IV pilus twitching motility protein PilT [Clostridium]AAK79656.1 PilT ATPase involved in pili biogenesis [Clostridium acetobutylicum ATCC 824]ADZ20740.1 PilT ATPase [Clostridium acetobutylicum EA 2018]AEI33611.1 PilT ATPase involved in pili biogenesis [Clostridium acetobutylicum DSM 1731]AWV79908.1 type IV pilus twitching motility protein PilT [Clostridium acetobutylicum]KHD37987.1 twitching motility protein PilT [Clostridium acetobutylicum]